MTKIVSFGCRLNSFESELIRKHVVAAGLKDVVVVHSCAVTAEAERQTRQAVRKALEQGKRVIVAGCSAQKSPEAYTALGVTAVLGNKEKLLLSSYIGLEGKGTRVLVSGEVSAEPRIAPDKFELKTKAFIQIQQGCNYACAYCIVPTLRGKSQSFSSKYIFEQIESALNGGYKEVVLTGVDIASFTDLPALTEEILARFPGLPRIRFSSLDPAANPDWLFRLMAAEPRIMPHIHISMQSGDDSVLKNMGRRHKAVDVLALAASARGLVPHIGIGADVIAGFPGETVEHFKNTYDLIEKCKIPLLHVFAYSKREGTRAATMPGQVGAADKKSRAARLRLLGDRLKKDFIAGQMGSVRPVLIEAKGAGYTDNYIKLKVNAPKNTIVDTEISPASIIV